FGTGQEQYQAGKIGLDTRNLADYIAQTEKERIQSSPQYMQELEAAGMTPLEQILAAGTSQFENILDPTSFLRPEAGLQTGIQAGTGILGLANDTQTRALQGLNNMLGGNAEIDKLIKGYDKIAGSSLDSLSGNLMNQVGGVDAARQGKIDQAIAKLSGF